MNTNKKIRTIYHQVFGLIGLSLIILVHEFGHFFAAKLFGVGVPIFSVGFGPRLFGYQIGQTVFQLAAIPFGGYVSMNPADLAIQPYGYKMIIILAGIVFNIFFTYLVLVYFVWHGEYKTIKSEHPTLDMPTGWLGTKWKTKLVDKPTLLQAFIEGSYAVITMLGNIGQVTSALFKKENGPRITGPIGIISMTAKSFAISTHYFILVLAIISANIAIFNLLPIPFLDGGQAVRYTIEALFGPLPEAIVYYFTMFFLLLFFLLILFITMKDIGRLRKGR